MDFDASNFLVPQISPNEIDIEKIEVQVLKVHIHCDGCKRKVKKIVRKIEGVFEADINKEYQKVTIKGTANIDDVINKLIQSGKHAEIWPENEDQNLSYNDWFSSLSGTENIPMMYPNLGLERENERVYSEFGIHDMMNPSHAYNNGQACDADMLSNMLSMINIKEKLNGENIGFDASSFNNPLFATMNNMEGRTRNRKLPVMRNVNMNNRETPQYKQVTSNIDNQYMQEMSNVSNQVTPQQMRYMDNMNQVMHQYTREMNNMNNHLIPRHMQEMDYQNNRVMPRYIREMENMHGRVVPQYVQEMNYMNDQLMSRHMQDMSNTNNNVIPRYMQDMENTNTHAMPQDMLENQYLTSYGSPFLPNYYTAPPYPYRYNQNNFI